MKIYQAIAKNYVNVRTAPFTISSFIQKLPPGTVINYSGIVKGENIQGNDSWFQGASNGGFLWSGALALIQVANTEKIIMWKETQNILIGLFEQYFNMSVEGIPIETILLYMEGKVLEPNSYSQRLILDIYEDPTRKIYNIFKPGFQEIHEAWEPIQ